MPWAVYASRSYVERNGRPRSPEDIKNHCIIEFTGEIAALAAARWLPSKAPQARISGQASNVPSVLLAVKSGGGLAPLPAPLADLDQDLVRVIGPIPELDYPTYLFTHRDLRKIPRIAAFFDYCLSRLRPVLTGAEPRRRFSQCDASRYCFRHFASGSSCDIAARPPEVTVPPPQSDIQWTSLFGSSGWRREKASRCLVRLADRFIASAAP